MSTGGRADISERFLQRSLYPLEIAATGGDDFGKGQTVLHLGLDSLHLQAGNCADGGHCPIAIYLSRAYRYTSFE